MNKDTLLKILQPICTIKIEEITSPSNLENVPMDVTCLLTEAIEFLRCKKFDECINNLQTVLDVTWEDLNTGHWSLVPESQRSVFAATSLLKVVSLVCQTLESVEDISLSSLEPAVETADMGLLLGNSHREQLTLAAQLLTQAINSERPKLESEVLKHSDSATNLIKVSTEAVTQLHCPSLETFSSLHFYPRVPVKLTGCMSDWPALQRWSDLNYLLEQAGSRTVPVELGSSYSDSEWSQKLMTLREFIIQYVNNSTTPTPGYLAQHQLFDQVPQLKNDIRVPDYCACSDLSEEEEDGEGDVDINAWFGPCGTVSPLHHDPKHNLLSQVVGKKHIVLYAPAATDCLYPHEGRLLANTARVDPENPDFKQFPRYRDTQAYLCLLSPGEMLYIPPTWWHHVRSLDVSFSVSFWWR